MSDTFSIHISARIRVAEAYLITETLEDGTWKWVAQDRALAGEGSATEQAEKYAHAMSTGDASGYNYGFVLAAIECGRHNTTEKAIGLSAMKRSLESAKAIGERLSTMTWSGNDPADLRNARIDINSALGWLQEVVKRAQHRAIKEPTNAISKKERINE